jgi:Zn-dependent protease with chaperone function
MSTDFFQQQDTARRRTVRLLFLLALAVLALIGLVYVLCVGLFDFGLGRAGPEHTLWHPWLLLGTAAAVLLVVGGGALFQAAQLAAGGKAVALMVGGRQVSGETRDFRERRLLNVVEEMALASGTPVPAVYILPGEGGINAFAAGHTPGDAVVAVSAGCLDYLTRDELQGVVAHEFSHILNGDMRLNVRMMALLHGLVVLSMLGWLVVEIASSSRRASRNEKDDNAGAAFLLLGFGVYFLGLLGVTVSQLIKAAVSRQREYLADASAVQFTRNPDGIAGALKKIGGLARGGTIKNARAVEVSHMFLAEAFSRSGLSGFLATHPPLAERIRRVDPHWDGNYPDVPRLSDEREAEEAPAPAARPAPLSKLPGFPNPILGAAVLAREGDRGLPKPLPGVALPQVVLPAALCAAAREPFRARALVYALLLSPDPRRRAAQLDRLKAGPDPRASAETVRLADAVLALPDAARLPLVDLALPALGRMSPSQYLAFREQAGRLVAGADEPSLFEYALACVLRRHLDSAFRRAKPPVARYREPALLTPEIVLLLSRLAWEGQDAEADATRAFKAGLRTYPTKAAHRLLPKEKCTLERVDAALGAFAEALPEIKRQALKACLACVAADGKVVPREAELIRAIGGTLNCPVPPMTRVLGS